MVHLIQDDYETMRPNKLTESFSIDQFRIKALFSSTNHNTPSILCYQFTLL